MVLGTLQLRVQLLVQAAAADCFRQCAQLGIAHPCENYTIDVRSCNTGFACVKLRTKSSGLQYQQ
jgi:hypothetical protein